MSETNLAAFEKIIKALPSCVYYKDTEGKYVFATHYWAHIERPARERKHDFAYVEMPMSREEAVQECGRCLRCDHFGCGAVEGGRIQYV